VGQNKHTHTHTHTHTHIHKAVSCSKQPGLINAVRH